MGTIEIGTDAAEARRFAFRLPDLGEGVAEAEIVAWHVAVGDRLEEDQPLVDLMTDKATVEVTTPVAGRVAVLFGGVGDRLQVGTTLVELALDGDAGGHAGTATAEAVVEPVPGRAPEAPFVPPPVPEGGAGAAGGGAAAMRVPSPALPSATSPSARPVAAEGAGAPLAAPATRKRAHELGVDLARVPGSGPAGRITPADLDAFVARGGTAPAGPGPGGGGRVKREAVHAVRIVGLRRRIAERMELATRRIPHFSYVEQFDLTELEELRRSLNAEKVEERPKLTMLPFFMRAVAVLVPAMPQINARYDDEAGVLHTHEAVHVGIATQTEAGLVVPVVRHVEALDLWGCARELGRVTQAARNGTATAAELGGSTITLTSLGTLGGISATPIINHPEVAIVGPNRLEQRPVVRGGQVVVREVMNVSSSFDHRIIDGYGAAQFIQGLRTLLEQPARLFMADAA